ncbi:class I SAM-dependent methyltransferase [Cyclobacterium amurskyense]|uniref:Methyltransferase type 11 n=1 Tax=Cyclobacterium amurskyense TaxID=320787 RepID=A0A0H4PK85_9BACT|nr:methyltransferase domain-containing protein [Cyclobacterium amurskyense]AKP53403.1 Methyltransferase type 11 [Cyclobacterium amurskyense]
MRYLLIVLSFFFLCLSGEVTAQTENDYSQKEPSRDGIGKVYMGREISHVMGFHGVAWLERDSREEEENTKLTISKLPISENSKVADVGAGSGFYTFRIADKVPKGKVYAVDIQKEALNYIKNKAEKQKVDNVIPVLGTEKSPNLPENTLDLVIMVDVYHELAFPKEMLLNIKKSLNPTGKLLLIEYRGEDPKVAIKPLHKMTVKQVKKELEANGFKLTTNGQFLNIQHFLVFEKED